MQVNGAFPLRHNYQTKLHIHRANIMKVKCTFLAKIVYINAFNGVTMLLFPPKDVGRMLLCKRHYSLPVTSGQAPR